MQQLNVNTDKPGEYATETHPEGYGFFATANCSDISGMSANPNNPTVNKALDDSGEKDSLVTGRDLWEDHSSSMNWSGDEGKEKTKKKNMKRQGQHYFSYNPMGNKSKQEMCIMRSSPPASTCIAALTICFIKKERLEAYLNSREAVSLQNPNWEMVHS